MNENKPVIFQFYHWYFEATDNLWNTCGDESNRLAALGITHVWLPPAYKSAKKDEPGYAVYDLYDLGEFDQKGSVRTKHGTREEYLECIQRLQSNGVQVLADIVLNHKFQGRVPGSGKSSKEDLLNPGVKLLQNKAPQAHWWRIYNFRGTFCKVT